MLADVLGLQAAQHAAPATIVRTAILEVLAASVLQAGLDTELLRELLHTIKLRRRTEHRRTEHQITIVSHESSRHPDIARRIQPPGRKLITARAM